VNRILLVGEVQLYDLTSTCHRYLDTLQLPCCTSPLSPLRTHRDLCAFKLIRLLFAIVTMLVTVKAKSLQDAHQLVDETGFLNPSYWLKAGDGNVAYRGLTAQLVTREGLLANAHWVYNQAVQAKVFVGAAADGPSKEQVQAIVDILNSPWMDCWYPTSYQVTRYQCLVAFDSLNRSGQYFPAAH
jgi:hypothetical protein